MKLTFLLLLLFRSYTNLKEENELYSIINNFAVDL